MGILSATGTNNGFTNWWDQHRNAITGFGVGLANGPTFSQGIGMGTQGLASGAKADDAYATQQKVEAERLDGINKTAEFLRAKGREDLIPLLEAGQANLALSQVFAGAGDGFSLNPGEIRYDANGKQIAAAPAIDKPPAAPTLTSIYDANGREQKGYMNGTEFVPVGDPKATIERPEFTGVQATAAGYADRMVQADKILDDPKLAAVQTDITQKGLGGVPVIGNMLTSPEFQQAEQAQRDFINAILRRESGAAIAASEFESARKQYFPQPGDSPQVLEQKKQNRLNAIKGVARSAGPAYEIPGGGESTGDPELDQLLSEYGT
jgi:hypothetical protein